MLEVIDNQLVKIHDKHFAPFISAEEIAQRAEADGFETRVRWTTPSVTETSFPEGLLWSIGLV